MGYRDLQGSATREKLFHHSLSISQNKTEISPHNLHEYWLGFKWEKTHALGQKHNWYNPKDLGFIAVIFFCTFKPELLQVSVWQLLALDPRHNRVLGAINCALFPKISQFKKPMSFTAETWSQFKC